MDASALFTSAVVAAVVGGLVTYFGQRQLAERQAQIDYEANARRRLYEAIGPLRFQLLLAARDLASRVASHAGHKWNLSSGDYYARSFIYRLLRPLAIGHLIERQMSIADFTVDHAALDLLRFNTTAYRMLTGSEAILDHPEADWSTQSQHVFRENLSAAATTLISQSPSGAVIVDFARFTEMIPEPRRHGALAPLAALFDDRDGNLAENAVFWVRVVGYAHSCAQLVRDHGMRLGFSAPELDVLEALREIDDRYLTERMDTIPQAFSQVLAAGL